MLANKVTATTKKLTELCDNPTEMLTVLLHVTATALSFVTRDMSEADAGKYVASYLLQSTKILDALGGERRGEQRKSLRTLPSDLVPPGARRLPSYGGRA